MVLQGVPINRIAKILNKKGILSPNKYHYSIGLLKNPKYENMLWTFSSVKKICENYTYTGNLTQRKTMTEVLKKTKTMNKSEWVIVSNTHEAIIDIDTFKKVDEVLSAKSKKYFSNL